VLATRDDAAAVAYGHLAIPQEALTDYPINLAAFRARANQWRDQSLSDRTAQIDPVRSHEQRKRTFHS
jgi:hypothetical protein